MTSKPLRVALWCAVSSKRQAADDKVSLDDQEAMGRAFAVAIGGQVTHVFRVPGHTRDIVLWSDAESEMDAYRELREALGQFDVLHALDMDRLGRTLALGAQVVALIERSGGEVYIATAPHQLGQPSTAQSYLYAIQGVRAQEDQQLRTIRLVKGMRGRVRRGLIASRMPDGYEVIRDEAGEAVGAKLDGLAPAVLLATDLFLRGESYAGICRELERHGYRPRRGDAWSYSTVADWMANDTYAGLPHYGAAQADGVSDAYPPLWDADTHRAIVRERSRRREANARARRQVGPLLHVVYCGRCGSPMTRKSNPGESQSLRCSRHSRTRDCHPNHILEHTVIDTLKAFLVAFADQDIERYIDEVTPGRDYTAELARLDGEIATTEEKRQRIALAFAAGEMDAAMYRATDDVLVDDLDRLRVARVEIDRERESQPDPRELRAHLYDLRARADSLFDQPPRQVSAALQSIGLRVLVEDRRVTEIQIG